MTAGDGNIPASNTSALLYARTRASTETIHPPPPADTQRRMSTPVSVRGSASRRPATGDQRGGTYIRRTGVETEREGERGRERRKREGERAREEVLKLADRSLVMAVRSSLYREFK